MEKIKIDNEDIFKKALSYFENSSDSIEVKKSDSSLKNIQGNIYGLYVDDELKYIGDRQSDKIASRLNEHLHKCSESTNSKLKEVTEAYNSNKKVSYKTLLIEPDYQRYALEVYLIQNIDSLPWNIRDKKRIVSFDTCDDDEMLIAVDKVNDNKNDNN